MNSDRSSAAEVSKLMADLDFFAPGTEVVALRRIGVERRSRSRARLVEEVVAMAGRDG